MRQKLAPSSLMMILTYACIPLGVIAFFLVFVLELDLIHYVIPAIPIFVTFGLMIVFMILAVFIDKHYRDSGVWSKEFSAGHINIINVTQLLYRQGYIVNPIGSNGAKAIRKAEGSFGSNEQHINIEINFDQIKITTYLINRKGAQKTALYGLPWIPQAKRRKQFAEILDYLYAPPNIKI